MKLKHMQREVENAKPSGTKHYAANENLRKRVSNRKISSRFRVFLALPGGTAFNAVFWRDNMLRLLQGTPIPFSFFNDFEEKEKTLVSK